MTATAPNVECRANLDPSVRWTPLVRDFNRDWQPGGSFADHRFHNLDRAVAFAQGVANRDQRDVAVMMPSSGSAAVVRPNTVV